MSDEATSVEVSAPADQQLAKELVQRGSSQWQLAEAVGVSRQTINSIETGR